jgi:hypothetical protein
MIVAQVILRKLVVHVHVLIMFISFLTFDYNPFKMR